MKIQINTSKFCDFTNISKWFFYWIILLRITSTELYTHLDAATSLTLWCYDVATRLTLIWVVVVVVVVGDSKRCNLGIFVALRNFLLQTFGLIWYP